MFTSTSSTAATESAPASSVPTTSVSSPSSMFSLSLKTAFPIRFRDLASQFSIDNFVNKIDSKNDALSENKLGAGTFNAVYSNIYNSDIKAVAHPLALSLPKRVKVNGGVVESRQGKSQKLLAEHNVDTQFLQVLKYHGAQGHVLSDLADQKDLCSYLGCRSLALNWEDLKSILAQVVLGVAALHEKGLAHYDLKAANILVFSLPQSGIHAVVADLDDLALVESVNKMSSHDLYIYYSPERIMRKNPASQAEALLSSAEAFASDCHALGITLLECFLLNYRKLSDGLCRIGEKVSILQELYRCYNLDVHDYDSESWKRRFFICEIVEGFVNQSAYFADHFAIDAEEFKRFFDLVKGLIEFRVSARLTMLDVKKHPFFGPQPEVFFQKIRQMCPSEDKLPTPPGHIQFRHWVEGIRTPSKVEEINSVRVDQSWASEFQVKVAKMNDSSTFGGPLAFFRCVEMFSKANEAVDSDVSASHSHYICP